MISQSMHYLSLFTMGGCRKMATLKTLSVCQKIFFQHQSSSCTSSVCLKHICKVLKRSNESSNMCWFHKVCTIYHYLLCAVVGKWLSWKPCQFVKINFFSIKLPHAHLQYVCNISANCWKDPVKGLRGVDFTKYALSMVIY